MDGPSSRTLHEKVPLIFRIDTSRRQLRAVAILAILAIARPAAQAAYSSGCESLAGQKLPNTTITAAQAITTGSFTPPGSTNPITNLPPFCRVAGVIAPTSESQIVFELWLPLEKWNCKFAGVCNGVVDRLRPLCPYPRVAVYKGKGDTNDMANFECRAAPSGR